MRAVLEKYRPVAVMHFAAFAYIGESVEKPAMYHRNNVEASTAFLKALLDYKPLPLVFSSTCATYGIPDRLRDHRGLSAAADQSLRRDQADRRRDARRDGPHA